MNMEPEKEKKSPYDMTDRLASEEGATGYSPWVKDNQENEAMGAEGPLKKAEPVSPDFDSINSLLGSAVEESIARARGTADALASGGASARAALRTRDMARSMVPADTPERRRGLYVTTQGGVEEATRDFFHSQMKPLLDEERSRAEAAAGKKLEDFALHADMASSPLEGMGAAQREADPAGVMERVMQRVDKNKLNDIAQALADYGGYNAEAYRDQVLIPALRNRLIDDYVERGKPRNWGENLLREGIKGSLVGKLGELGMRNVSGTRSWEQLDELQSERYNPTGLEKVGSGSLSLLMDAPLFGGYRLLAQPVVKGATVLLTKRVAGELASRGVEEAAAQGVARRLVAQKLSTKIAQAGLGQGLTLGGFDATHNVVDQVMQKGSVDVGEVARSFGSGVGTGVALGAVGTPIGEASRGLRGLRRTLASTGALAADAGVFTLATEAEKALHGVKIEPIDLLYDYGHSAGTLLSMRLPHFVAQGAARKITPQGTLIPQLRFTAAEQQELREAGVDGKNLENVTVALLGTPSSSFTPNGETQRRKVDTAYSRVMNNPDISATLKGKLLYLVEDKMTATPPLATDFTAQADGGGYRVTTVDMNGRPVEKMIFSTPSQYRSFVKHSAPFLQRNRIVANENLLQGVVDNDLFFTTASRYAREKGVSQEELATSLYRDAQGEPLNGSEAELVEGLRNKVRSNGYGRSASAELQRAVESRMGLEIGGLKRAFDKEPSQLSATEREALTQYGDLLEERCDSYREAEAESMGLPASRSRDEIENSSPLQTYVNQMQGGNLNESQSGGSRANVAAEREKWNNIYKKEAQLMARALGTDVNLVENVEGMGRLQNPDVKGLYNPAADEVSVVLPHIDNVVDMQRTVLHEVVGHRGLRNLLGHDFGKFLNEAYEGGDASLVKAVDEMRENNGYSREDATEEYLSRIAEEGADTAPQKGLLQKFGNFLSSSLRRMGVQMHTRLDDGELRSILLESRSAISGHPLDKAMEMAIRSRVKEAAQGTTRRPLYRFMGEVALGNLEKRGGERTRKLEQAKEMKSRGAEVQDIKRKTGWEVGADGRWRFETDDYGFRFYETPYDKMRHEDVGDYLTFSDLMGRSQREILPQRDIDKLQTLYRRYGLGHSVGVLPDYVSDTMLFKAYPALKKVKVVFTDELPSYQTCRYDKRNGTFWVNDDMIKELHSYRGDSPSYTQGEYQLDKEMLRTSVLAELQRAIQQEEHFAGSYSLRGIFPQENEEYQRILARAYALGSFVHSRQQEGDEKGTAEPKVEESHEYQRFVEEQGCTPQQFVKKYPTPDEYILEKSFKMPVTQMGDEERRNVARRRNMLYEERLQSPAEQTERYPRGRQIELKPGDFSSSFMPDRLNEARRTLESTRSFLEELNKKEDGKDDGKKKKK